MTWWSIEPHDPLMIRDGRPFGVDTDGARSLDFPTPSAVAGTLRTRIGFDGNPGTFGLTVAQALEISVRGPILADASSDRMWLPAPRDAVLFEAEAHGDWPRYRLQPGAAWADGESSLPNTLLPVEGVVALPTTKTAKDAPAFWSDTALRAWLSAPAAKADLLHQADGHKPLEHERRTHVAIDGDTGTAGDGMLFETDGLRLAREIRHEGHGAAAKLTRERLVFLVECLDTRLKPGMITLGGERRLSMLLVRGTPAISGWSAPALSNGRARVVVLTPTLFRDGAVPDTIHRAKVVAAAVGRPQTISGWDLAKREPKATRRMAPAGSVYWVELGDQDPRKWASEVHLRNISDKAQDCLDGFGLAAVGVWP